METVIVGAAFVAVFAWWWVRKPDWNHNHEGADTLRGTQLEVPPPALVSHAAPGASFRSDIEGLRAIAVLLVLLYHADLLGVSGGFIGVDVFFVLSGFLITSLLLRELATTGTVSLSNFWARRARRLLPASGLVLVATLLFSRIALDGLSQAELARDAFAACAFVANIRFYAVGTDYLTSQLPPSPLLHFWSLAVEEQFYFVWPGLLMLLVRRMRISRRGLAIVLGAMWAVSFAVCVWFTAHDQPWAFFMLPARTWELLTGAGLAFVGGALVRLPKHQRALLGWIGLIVVIVSAVAFDGSMRFPGWIAAIPVLATAAIINAGGVAAGPVRVLRATPLQWVGARSYAIYLWHFPILILVDRKWGPLSAPARVGLLVLAVLLAAVSYQLIENPVRHSRSLAASPARSLVMGGWVALIGVACAALVLHNPPRLDAGVEAVVPTIATVAPTTVAPSLPSVLDSTTTSTTTTAAPAPVADASHDNPPALAPLIAANEATLASAAQTTKVPSNLSPSLRSARSDLPPIYDNGCILDVGVNTPKDCLYGDPGGSITVVLFGDSHAAQWMPALNKVGAANGWRIIVHVKKACPTADIPTDKDRSRTDCAVWRDAVLQRIGQLQPDLVIMSAYRYKQVGAAAGRDPDAVWQEGLDLTMSTLRPSAKHVLLLGDSATPISDVPSCLASNVSNVQQCMNSREGAVRPGRLAVERDIAAKYDADFIPTSDWMCTDAYCPPVVGNVLMYRDNSHITATASAFLSPYFDAAVRSVLS